MRGNNNLDSGNNGRNSPANNNNKGRAPLDSFAATQHLDMWVNCLQPLLWWTAVHFYISVLAAVDFLKNWKEAKAFKNTVYLLPLDLLTV